MKTKHIIAGESAAIIGGSIWYFMKRPSKNNLPEPKQVKATKVGEEKIRRVMHHAKEALHSS